MDKEIPARFDMQAKKPEMKICPHLSISVLFWETVLDCHDHPDASPEAGSNINNNYRAIRLLQGKAIH